MFDKSRLNNIFDNIMAGNGSIITDDNIQFLNSVALELYDIPALDNDQVDSLKKIIMMCNVLYNRTDSTIMVIEDGFYDILLEKYKTYDPHFQVGSAVVDFRNFIENDINHQQTKIAECPVTFDKAPEPKSEIHKELRSNIMRTDRDVAIDARDFYECPVTFNNDYISKRTHNTEHNHPTLIGTLDKAKFVLNQDAIDAGVFNDSNIKVLERDFFQDHISKGILDPNRKIGIVAELKYDGISVEADCNFTVQSARTRGDTGAGVASDISPILSGYTFKHANAMIGENPIGVKFEAIITKSNLELFNQLRGRSYVNCRSAIVGLFGASDAYKYRDLITLVPLAVDREQLPQISNRLEEINLINNLFVSHGEPLRYAYFYGTVTEILYYIKAFWDEAKIARDYLNFMYDGIVISYLDEDIREKLGRKNYINKFSMAVKFDPLEKQTIFRGYTYEVGQHGNITPMLHYDPVTFNGTIHTKSTGSSLKRFNDLALKYGDYINVTYVNDVMPYVSRVECDHNRRNTNPIIPIIDKCPICGSELVISDSGKTLLCPNMECPGRSTQRMVNMFSKLGIKGFAEASFKELQKTHLNELYTLSPIELINILGEADGKAFYQSLRDLVTLPQKDYMVMGSLGFTSIAYKKWQSILQNITLYDLNRMYLDCNDDYKFKLAMLQTIPGIGNITSEVISNEWKFFENDIDFILKNVHLENSYGVNKSYKGEIRFTGFRNSQLCEQLCNLGYDADDNASVTKKTDILLVPYEGFTSGKVQKAQKNPNCKIIAVTNINSILEHQ